MENPMNKWMIWGVKPLFLEGHPCDQPGKARSAPTATVRQLLANEARSRQRRRQREEEDVFFCFSILCRGVFWGIRSQVSTIVLGGLFPDDSCLATFLP